MSTYLTNLTQDLGMATYWGRLCIPAPLPGHDAFVWEVSGENRRTDPVLVGIGKL